MFGTIDIDGDVYDMLFFNLGDGSPPNRERAGSYIEIWAIYDGLELSLRRGVRDRGIRR